MKGVHFYADIPGTQNDEGVAYVPARITVKQLDEWSQPGDDYTAVNVIAILIGDDHKNNDGTQEALVSTFAWQDSDVSLGAVSREYLRKCRRISESLARRLHPRLFARLDAAE